MPSAPTPESFFDPARDYPETWAAIPGYMQEAILDYIRFGHHVGDFLRSVFENNLMEAGMRADATNSRALKAYAMLLLIVPIPSKGSEEAVDKWIESKGLAGIFAPITISET